jgi:aquaporin Z
MIMVYAGGHISGGHYNPAVTLAVWMRGRCAGKDVPGYMIAQVIGGVIAALIVLYLKSGSHIEASVLLPFPSLVAEFLLTFALCYVVLKVATSKNTQGNSYYGLAIGFTVTVGAYSVGSMSGAAFNPAVAIGVTVMGVSFVKNIWIFLVANLIGGAIAAVVFNSLNPDDK